MVSSKEVNTKKDSWRTKGWPIWDAARKEAGINPNDETANMFPSEAVAYRLLRDAKFVPNQTFYDTVFEGRKLKKPLLSLNQVIIGLRRKLQESIGATVVSVRSEGNSGYALAALGERQETIERYRKEDNQDGGEAGGEIRRGCFAHVARASARLRARLRPRA